ncbi:hypothetical protein BUALT_Bualt02G0068000 [Buddleja alternifolia]|uniref:Zinc knuckle CX2CX4HX4C domain-containing protein n=1 Tax=Buddleja alternifolia TaxID=168488 RepID=A0AAV6Y963_9LAMI|nr:hypothetical protein BUALT_Bualt02G0068000 [Buddleja alternifolia]
MIPEGLCNGEYSNKELMLVGGLLSSRPYNFEAFRNTITRIIHPLQGLTVRKISVERFDNPSTMPLDMCTFRVHILDPPSKMMTREVAIFVGNRLGRFKDVHLDNSGVSWDSTLKLTIEIDVTKPLKRVLQLNSPLGESYIVTFQYERLPNFRYVCSKIGHLATCCLLRYSKDFKDLGDHTAFGPWLRAPLSNSRGQSNNSNRFLFSERPNYATPSQSQSGNHSSQVRPASHLDGDPDMDFRQPVLSKNITFLSRSPYPFTNNHALILSAPLSPIGNKADAILSHQNGLGDDISVVKPTFQPSLSLHDEGQTSGLFARASPFLTEGTSSYGLRI